MIIKASRHIFANVEKEESPRGIRGFQSLYYTLDEISEDEKYQLEEPAFFHEIPKKQFYRLGDRFVITSISPLEGADKFGGQGRYISSGFIFSKDDFAGVGNNPLVLFRVARDKFIGDLETAKTQGDFDTGNIGKIEIEVTPGMIKEIDDNAIQALKRWSREELKKLARMAVNGALLEERRNTLAPVGGMDEIMETLGLLYFFLPMELRAGWSFDTDYYNPRIRLPYFRAGGFSPEESPQSTLFIKVENRKISGDEIPVEITPYLNWLTAALEEDNAAEITGFREEIYLLEKVMTGKAGVGEAMENITPLAMERFISSNRALVKKKCRKTLEEKLGERITELIGDSWLKKAESVPKQVLKLMSGTADLKDAAPLVRECLSGTPVKNPDGDFSEQLETLAIAANDNILKAVSHYWGKRTTGDLDSLAEQQYRLFLKIVFKGGVNSPDYKYLIPPGRKKLFNDVFMEAAMRDRDLIKELPGLLSYYTELNIRDGLQEFRTLLDGISPEEKKILAEESRDIKVDLGSRISGALGIATVNESKEPGKTGERKAKKKEGGLLGKIWPFSGK